VLGRIRAVARSKTLPARYKNEGGETTRGIKSLSVPPGCHGAAGKMKKNHSDMKRQMSPIGVDSARGSHGDGGAVPGIDWKCSPAAKGPRALFAREHRIDIHTSYFAASRPLERRA